MNSKYRSLTNFQQTIFLVASWICELHDSDEEFTVQCAKYDYVVPNFSHVWFLDVLTSLDFKLSLSEWYMSFGYAVNQVIQLTQVMQIMQDNQDYRDNWDNRDNRDNRDNQDNRHNRSNRNNRDNRDNWDIQVRLAHLWVDFRVISRRAET